MKKKLIVLSLFLTLGLFTANLGSYEAVAQTDTISADKDNDDYTYWNDIDGYCCENGDSVCVGPVVVIGKPIP